MSSPIGLSWEAESPFISLVLFDFHHPQFPSTSSIICIPGYDGNFLRFSHGTIGMITKDGEFVNMLAGKKEGNNKEVERMKLAMVPLTEVL